MSNQALDLALKYKTLLEQYGVDTPLRKAHFFAQIHHESNLAPVAENLNYSTYALQAVFRKYFPTETVAQGFARSPERIANRVYASRMGNGNEDSGDGWRYRGRGFIQLTGRCNYQALSKACDIDYETDPDKLLKEPDAMRAALWFWQTNGLNDLADKDDVRAVTRRINGGYNGLDHRQELTEKYREVFNA